ncbi:MAG: transcription termination/antitermination NusG family protein [Thermoguttaceae bacterium]|jgi:transcriptional antiterminator RfaH
MPLLGKEPDLFPEGLLDVPSDETNDRHWFVLYTKPRQEKALARQLLGYRIPFYLPLVKKTSLIQGKKRHSFIPLFAGYVFLCASHAERLQSLATNRIFRVLPVDDFDRLLTDLRQLRQMIAAQMPLTVESRLVPGDRVRVRQGSFAGIEGTVLTRRGRTRLLVAINFLQQGASVEIDDFLLEPLA